jgi:hypothetical protein
MVEHYVQHLWKINMRLSHMCSGSGQETNTEPAMTVRFLYMDAIWPQIITCGYLSHKKVIIPWFQNVIYPW